MGPRPATLRYRWPRRSLQRATRRASFRTMIPEPDGTDGPVRSTETDRPDSPPVQRTLHGRTGTVRGRPPLVAPSWRPTFGRSDDVVGSPDGAQRLERFALLPQPFHRNPRVLLSLRRLRVVGTCSLRNGYLFGSFRRKVFRQRPDLVTGLDLSSELADIVDRIRELQ